MALAEIIRKLLAKRADDSARPQAGARQGLPWPLLAALCVILVCAVAWAFFMGLMVGRGQSPQSEIAAIAGLNAPDPVEDAKSGAPQTEMTEAEILPLPAQTSEMPQNAEPPKPAPPKPPVQTPRKPAAQPAVKKTPASAERFDYVFQAAAYRSQSEANEASAKLAKSGFRSSVRKSGKVWLIIVNLRGSQRQVDSLTQKMKSLKMGKPMQLSRKEIAKKAR